ncbi:MAG: hypothetical protein ACREQB_07885 [Candidatus Binataceae bacterium]
MPAKDPALLGLHERLDQVAKLKDNWDGHGSSHPDVLSVWTARQFLEDVYRQIIVATARQTQEDVTPSWQAPHISASEDGEIVFEWWNGNRKLTIYVGPLELTYIKSWGPHVLNDMEDGVIRDGGISSLWGWLFG